jgi:endonuclease YncB( thermonuclease family)
LPIALGLLLAGALGAAGTQYFISNGVTSSRPGTAAPNTPAGAVHFTLCAVSLRQYCVIDGDTIRYKGVKVRFLDIDAPEISAPKCASEEALGHKAKLRVLEILNSGPVEVVARGSRDKDVYGRKLRLILRSGRSVGDMLVAEGLAWPWEGHRHRWC